MNKQRPIAKLALADGTVYSGRAFGFLDHDQPVTGEVVFNTSMTGYQEILTDPSYTAQIVTMTYTQIGNYGVNLEDMESARIQVAGFIVRELAHLHSNFRANTSIDQWLCDQKVLGIEQLDTRALTRKLRIDGSINGVISCRELDDRKLVDAARQVPAMAGRNLACDVSCKANGSWQQTLENWQPIQGTIPQPDKPFHIVAIDCGAKSNILRHLAQRGCQITTVPFNTTAQQILALQPDGLFVSNGPGDPEPVEQTIATLRQLLDKLPIFGICLGHQLIALAMGAKTYKLKFGHRGGNQPVQNLATGKVEITSQNHGFAVDLDSLKATGCRATHINLNDRTLEGFCHQTMPIFAVQYHPEAAPGPHDSAYLFDCFMDMISSGKPPSAERMHQAQQLRNTVASSA